MREARLTVGDYASPGRGDVPNPCVMGCAHLFLGSLFVLGEGHGGSEGGRVESRLAVSAVLANFRSSSTSDPRERLAGALRHAGQVLEARARSGSAFRESWAGCTAVLYRRGRVFAARVGNLRLLVLSEGEVREIFEPLGDEPSPVLGQTPAPEVQILTEDLDLAPGDRLLLGNNALVEAVGLAEVGRLATTLVPAVAARRLVEAATQAGGGAVSVQVVQVGDSTVMEEAARRGAARRRDTGPISASPVAPVRMAASPSAPALGSLSRSVNPVSSGTHGSSPQLFSPSRGRRGVLIVAVVSALVLLVVAWRGLGTDTPPESTPSRGSDPVAVDASSSPQFWARVTDRLGERGQVLDPDEVETWISDPAEIERRLREARAVVAVLRARRSPSADPELLSESADQAPTEPGLQPGEPASDQPSVGAGVEESAPDLPGGALPIEGGRPEHPAADSPKDGAEKGNDRGSVVPRTADTPAEPSSEEPAEVGGPAQESPGVDAEWDPKSVPLRLRGFERIFSREPVLAARTLKGYIHRRHARSGKVFAALDAFLAIAPRARSIQVLSRIPEVQAGPKTRRWARHSLAALRSGASK